MPRSPARILKDLEFTKSGSVGLLLLIASALVLAFSWEVDFPQYVLLTAWVVAIAGAIVVVLYSWGEARETGHGIFASTLKSIKAFGRFLRDFA